MTEKKKTRTKDRSSKSLVRRTGGLGSEVERPKLKKGNNGDEDPRYNGTHPLRVEGFQAPWDTRPVGTGDQPNPHP